MQYDLFTAGKNHTTESAIEALCEHIRKMEQLLPPIAKLLPTTQHPKRTGNGYAEEIDQRLSDMYRAVSFLARASRK